MSKRKLEAKAPSAEAQLRGFIRKCAPKEQSLIRALRAALRRRLHGSCELAYDNYNFLVVGYGPTERPSDAIVSIAARAGGVGLCFIHGATLPDPKRILLGSGNQTRFIRLSSPRELDRPEIEALIAAAVTRANAPFLGGRTKLVIRSISAKRRPRRKRMQEHAA